MKRWRRTLASVCPSVVAGIFVFVMTGSILYQLIATAIVIITIQTIWDYWSIK